MSKSPKQIIREYFDFSKKDRNAVITLIILILLVTGAHFIVSNMQLKAKVDNPAFEIAMKRLQDESFIDTLQCRLFDFDPNYAGRDTLEDLGFNQYQISNLLKYRDNGGYFSVPSDLMKIYGIDSVFYNEVKKYIRINVYPSVNNSYKVDDNEISIELNKTDSAELIKLRGIGPVFASRIIKYRELLGGFYSCGQILEVYNFPEETYRNIRKYLYVDTLYIQKLRINFAGYNELIHHPYLDKNEVSNILDYRSKHGPFKNTYQFIGSNLTDSAKIDKIRPYISCR